MWWSRPTSAALAALLALAACSRPVARMPEVDRDRAKAEAEIQLAAIDHRLAGFRHPEPRDDDPIAKDLWEAGRLVQVGWRILTGAAPQCGERVSWQIGALFETIHDVGPLDGLWNQFNGLDRDPVVMAVAPGSPAEQGGLKIGDSVQAVDGRALLLNKDASAQLHDALDRNGPVTLDLKRGDQALSLTFRPVAACRSRVAHHRSERVNAYADGRMVMVTSGLIETMRDDDHLAVVLGHELAHNIMGHLEKQDENGRTGGRFGSVLSVLTGAPELKNHWAMMGEKAYSRSFEAEADYVGLYYAAAGGFSVANAPQFWRRMAAANPLSITHSTTHPTAPDRFVALEATAREIQAKRDAHLPVLPERK